MYADSKRPIAFKIHRSQMGDFLLEGLLCISIEYQLFFTTIQMKLAIVYAQ